MERLDGLDAEEKELLPQSIGKEMEAVERRTCLRESLCRDR